MSVNMQILFAVFALTTIAHARDGLKSRQLLGGFGPEYQIGQNNTERDEYALKAFDASVPQIEEKTGRLPKHDLKSYRLQVVQGTRYLFRVQVNTTTPEFIHVSVWQQLNGEVIVGSVAENKTFSDPLVPLV